jgi:hypothetical protein
LKRYFLKEDTSMNIFFKYTLALSVVAILFACGGGGGGEASSDRTSDGASSAGVVSGGGASDGATSGGGGTSAAAPSNTQAALNYATTRYATVQTSFLSAAESTAAKHAALGSLRGGNHLAESMDNYLAAVQSFLNDSITTARTLNAVFPVDSASVASLLRTFETQDANFIISYYGSWPFGTVSLVAINAARDRVNSAYSAAIANLP